MPDQVAGVPGEILRPVQAYLTDSNHCWSKIDRFDKLERMPEVVAEFAEDARLGYSSYRVRVVEFPIDPYPQWEMDRFRIRVECGENIRVVGPDAVARYGTNGIVSELIVMGSIAMYEVLHDETGVLPAAGSSPIRS